MATLPLAKALPGEHVTVLVVVRRGDAPHGGQVVVPLPFLDPLRRDDGGAVVLLDAAGAPRGALRGGRMGPLVDEAPLRDVVDVVVRAGRVVAVGVDGEDRRDLGQLVAVPLAFVLGALAVDRDAVGPYSAGGYGRPASSKRSVL